MNAAITGSFGTLAINYFQLIAEQAKNVFYCISFHFNCTQTDGMFENSTYRCPLVDKLCNSDSVQHFWPAALLLTC